MRKGEHNTSQQASQGTPREPYCKDTSCLDKSHDHIWSSEAPKARTVLRKIALDYCTALDNEDYEQAAGHLDSALNFLLTTPTAGRKQDLSSASPLDYVIGEDTKPSHNHNPNCQCYIIENELRAEQRERLAQLRKGLK